MACTKQTVRKKEGGKTVSHGERKGSKAERSRTQAGRVDRKVIIEYSSDEEFDDDNPQPVVGTGAPKSITKLCQHPLRM